MFRVNNKDTRTVTLYFGIFIVSLEHISNLVLVSLLLNLKMQLQVGKIDVLIEAYSALCQTLQLFAKIVNGLQSLTIFTKSFILDV